MKNVELNQLFTTDDTDSTDREDKNIFFDRIHEISVIRGKFFCLLY